MHSTFTNMVYFLSARRASRKGKGEGGAGARRAHGHESKQQDTYSSKQPCKWMHDHARRS